MKKFIFGFILGGCVSGAATYFIMKKKSQKEIDAARQQCEDIVAMMRVEYANKYSIQKAEILDKEDPEEIVKKYHDEAAPYDRRSDVVTGDKIISGADPAELESPSEDAPDEYYEDDDYGDKDITVEEPAELDGIKEGLAAAEYDNKYRKRAPERITREQYDNGAPGYEQHECSYYVEDCVFTDDSELVINNEEDLFGTAVDGWDDNDDDTDPIFIRNYMYQCDYMIEKMFCKSPQFINMND